MIRTAIRSQTGAPTTMTTRGDDDVERALDRPVGAGEDRRPQLEERDRLARHVLAALDQELRRPRRDAHLHAAPVRLLDDLEQLRLAEAASATISSSTWSAVKRGEQRRARAAPRPTNS